MFEEKVKSMRKSNIQDRIFEVTEKQLPLHGWQPEEGFDRLRLIERDIRSLMRELAEAKGSLSEEQIQHSNILKDSFLTILEVMDSFERVFNNINRRKELVTGKVKIWLNNFHTIQRLLGKFLLERGVTRIENLDQGFDPGWHKATETVVDTSKSEGTIIEEIKAGYVWKGQVLRKAEVVVVRNSQGNERVSDI